MLDTAPAPSPVMTEAVEGWRAWALAASRDLAEVRLLPIGTSGRPWPLREPARATCGRRRHNRVPDPACTCGLHAATSLNALRHARDPAVLGRVALWGRVIEHGRGFRGELGYPQRLGLACQLCFWQWGGSASSPCVSVLRRRNGRLLPLCDDHLELCRRYGYPIDAIVDAPSVERALLDAYAVDLLRIA
jgi:hypothetical protein